MSNPHLNQCLLLTIQNNHLAEGHHQATLLYQIYRDHLVQHSTLQLLLPVPLK
jgi:hypothetical protein